jgi:hypothetical protein
MTYVEYRLSIKERPTSGLIQGEWLGIDTDIEVETERSGIDEYELAVIVDGVRLEGSNQDSENHPQRYLYDIIRQPPFAGLLALPRAERQRIYNVRQKGGVYLYGAPKERSDKLLRGIHLQAEQEKPEAENLLITVKAASIDLHTKPPTAPFFLFVSTGMNQPGQIIRGQWSKWHYPRSSSV